MILVIGMATPMQQHSMRVYQKELSRTASCCFQGTSWTPKMSYLRCSTGPTVEYDSDHDLQLQYASAVNIFAGRPRIGCTRRFGMECGMVRETRGLTVPSRASTQVPGQEPRKWKWWTAGFHP